MARCNRTVTLSNKDRLKQKKVTAAGKFIYKKATIIVPGARVVAN
jgi:hypothetical protein